MIINQSDPYEKRLGILTNFLGQIEREFGYDFTAGIYGSMVIGKPTENSDIDTFFVIDPHDLMCFVKTKVFRDVFSAVPNNSVCEKFCSGSYDVYRNYGYINGIGIGIDISSVPFCERMTTMEDFLIQRFRHWPHYGRLQYRGFGYAYRQNTIPFDPIVSEEDGGYRAQVMSLIRVGQEPYFNIHIEKLFTVQFIVDYLDIQTLQYILRRSMYEEFLRTNHKDPYGFLFKRESATPEQLRRFEIC